MSALHVKFGKALVATIAFSAVGLLTPRTAHATLGGDAASVEANQKNLVGVREVKQLAYGERHDITLPSGTVVHEYVSPSGAVYAITWRGSRKPDMRELLGTYFTQLAAYKPTGAGHNRLSLTGTDFVVQAQGHQRWFTGRAWVPSMVPAGVTIDGALE